MAEQSQTDRIERMLQSAREVHAMIARQEEMLRNQIQELHALKEIEERR